MIPSKARARHRRATAAKGALSRVPAWARECGVGRFSCAWWWAMAGSVVLAAPSSADDGAVMHPVHYQIWSDRQVAAEIYYRDADPPSFTDYSHNPHEFSLNVETNIGPNQPWVLDVMLADPAQWAMALATGQSGAPPAGFHCKLVVDGSTVITNSGQKGALCSIRQW